MNNLIERTAKSDFQLDGKPIRAGQILTIDAFTLNRLVSAGCVEKSDEANSRVAVDRGPPVQREIVNADINVEQARVAEARQAADLEISALDDRLAARRLEVSTELDAVNVDLQAAIGKARADADAQISAINETVEERRATSQVEIDEINQTVDAAKTAKKSGKAPE